MTVMLVGWMGCKPAPRPTPDDGAVTGTKRERLVQSLRCVNGAPPTKHYVPDAGPTPQPLPDGGTLELVGCVIPPATVVFTSECARGTTITVSTQAGVVSDAETFCAPSDAGSVRGDGGEYIINISTQKGSCQLGIDKGASSDAKVSWQQETPECPHLWPIKGTVEVATTDVPACLGGDC
jgi:hypothetical protein